MDNMLCRKVVSTCDFCLPLWFLMSLCPHQLTAFLPKLHPSKCMYTVVDAVVTGMKAAKHLAVGGIHNSIGGKAGNITLPKLKIIVYALHIAKLYTSSLS